jgi:hypothetical protein
MFEGRHFVPFAKPPSQSDGNLNMFYTPVEYYIDWSVDSVSELYNFTRADVRRRLEPGFNGTAKQESERAAVIRNPSFYFSNCLHASSAGEEAPQVWAPWGGISGHKSSIVVPIRLDWKALLCLMSSHPFSLLVKPYRGSLADTGQEQLSMTSVPMNASTIDFGESIDSLIQKKKSGGILTRNDPEWNGVDKAISQALSFAQEDEAEVFLWRTRRFSRPGVIE